MSSKDKRNKGNKEEDFLQDCRNVYQDLCCCCIKNKTFLSCIPKFVTITQLLILILQAVGTFQNEWIIINNNTGSVNSTSTNIADIDFNQTAAEDVAIAVFAILIAIMVLIVVTFILLQIGKITSPEALKRICFIRIVPLANCISGVLGFSGCMLVASSEYEYGVSFHICLTASVIQILLLPTIFGLYMNMRHDYIGVRQDDKEQPTIHVGSEECTS